LPNLRTIRRRCDRQGFFELAGPTGRAILLRRGNRIIAHLSGVVGAMWQGRDNLSLDVGFSHAVVNGYPANELRAGNDVRFSHPEIKGHLGAIQRCVDDNARRGLYENNDLDPVLSCARLPRPSTYRVEDLLFKVCGRALRRSNDIHFQRIPGRVPAADGNGRWLRGTVKASRLEIENSK
jgi:hypothetical protein